MLAVEYSRWGQDPDILRVLGLNADHPRTRERFLALYEICGEKNASQVGRETGRNPQTVMDRRSPPVIFELASFRSSIWEALSGARMGAVA